MIVLRCTRRVSRWGKHSGPQDGCGAYKQPTVTEWQTTSPLYS